jgi:hypothetical protein
MDAAQAWLDKCLLEQSEREARNKGRPTLLTYPDDDEYAKLVKKFEQWCILHLRKTKGVNATLSALVGVLAEARRLLEKKVHLSNKQPVILTLQNLVPEQRLNFETMLNMTAFRTGQVIRQQYADYQNETFVPIVKNFEKTTRGATADIVKKIETYSSGEYSAKQWRIDYYAVEQKQCDIIREEIKRQHEQVVAVLEQMKADLLHFRTIDFKLYCKTRPTDRHACTLWDAERYAIVEDRQREKIEKALIARYWRERRLAMVAN